MQLESEFSQTPLYQPALDFRRLDHLTLAWHPPVRPSETAHTRRSAALVKIDKTDSVQSC
jgi:hypothetical protein